MQAKLGCGLVALMLLGSDSGPTGNAEVVVDFPSGSRWELVRGREGETPLEKVSMTVVDNDHLTVVWEAKAAGFSCQYASVYFVRDGRTGLPSIKRGYPPFWGV